MHNLITSWNIGVWKILSENLIGLEYLRNKQTNKQTEFSRVWGYVTGNRELQQKLLFKTVPIIEMDETHETLLLDFFSPEHGQK